MLGAILAGIISGTGSGVILKSYGSAGGLDILSVIFLKRFSVRLGTTVLVSNVVVLGAGSLLFSLEEALYTLIFIMFKDFLNILNKGFCLRSLSSGCPVCTSDGAKTGYRSSQGRWMSACPPFRQSKTSRPIISGLLHTEAAVSAGSLKHGNMLQV
jgi:hypothetical protein